jgi:hypothetical protein
MRIKGSIAKGFLVALVLSLIPVMAFSAQKVTAGSTCKVLNKKVVYQTKTFTCIKSGKKLVWNKGVPVKPGTMTASGPAFDTAKNFSELLSVSKIGVSKNIYLASPNLNISTFQFVIDTQEKFFRFWSSQGVLFSNPIKTYFFTELDKDWLLKTDVPRDCLIDNWFTAPFKTQADGRTCQTTDNRSIILFPTGSGFVTQKETFRDFGTQAAAHEIEHVVQNEVFNYQMPDPCWFREGLTTYSVWIETTFENTFVSMSNLKRNTYAKLMSSLKNSNIQVNGKTQDTWTNDEWYELLNFHPANPICWGRNKDGTVVSNPIFFGYAAGPFIVEKIYIDFGITETIKFIKRAGVLNNFASAFTETLGIAYKDWMLKNAIPWLLSGGN